MSAPAKLPLLVRKDIRDNFEGQKPDLEQRYRDLFGELYSFEADFPSLYAQAGEGWQQNSIGQVVYEAFRDATRNISSGTNDGQEKLLIDAFNRVVSKRTITVIIDPSLGNEYSGCRVTDGVFQILFMPKQLGTNSYNAAEYWKQAINEAVAQSDPKGLPPTAVLGIKDDYEERIKELEVKMSEQLGGEKITCYTDFANSWARIVEAHETLPKDKKADMDLDRLARNLGSYTYDYFSSLLQKLEGELQGDDLMIEGFLEAVTAKEACFELIPESAAFHGEWSMTTIEDGKLWSRTKPTKFGIFANESFQDFSKLL